MTHAHTTLADDLEHLLGARTDRRRSLRWLLGGAAGTGLALAGCGGGGTSDFGLTSGTTDTTGTTGTTTTPTASGTCSVIPEETAGPYPGDGTNGNGSGIANALALSGIVRADIRTSIAPGSATAAGIPTVVKLKIVNVGSGCASAAGAAVYLWHCDRDGNYSMYASGLTSENYLRGVQEADADGIVTFTTIFPGCYAGRMPHMHFEVYPSLAKATGAGNRVKTSQLTFPMATLNEAYATSAYAASARNLAGISYASDNVFGDGTSLQMAEVTGDAAAGYVATLTVGVAI